MGVGPDAGSGRHQSGQAPTTANANPAIATSPSSRARIGATGADPEVVVLGSHQLETGQGDGDRRAQGGARE